MEKPIVAGVQYRTLAIVSAAQSTCQKEVLSKPRIDEVVHIRKEQGCFDAAIDVHANPLPVAKVQRRARYTNEPDFDLRGYLYRIFGIDLTAIPGISVLTAHTLLAEVGTDISRFRSAAAFASWLGLCPDNDISGGKRLSVKTRHVNNRAAGALRMAVNGLQKSQTWLGNFFRRMRAKLGAPRAITATAHKLARIVYQLLSTRRFQHRMSLE